jgi:hypothetical protein
MIVFDLECSGGHRFEGWFNHIGSFEEQNAKNLVSCPVCGDGRIKKVISPVATCTLRSETEKRAAPPAIDYQKVAREIVEYVNTNFENVGTEFAKQALKMHYGIAEKKNIRGSATEEEEKALRQEKIDFFKIPLPKEESEEGN